MLACSHAEDSANPAPGRMCVHLLADPDLDYMVRFSGVGVQRDLLCGACSQTAKAGDALALQRVCRPCFEAVEAHSCCYEGHLGEARVTERASSLHFAPDSAVFFKNDGRLLLVHATEWNRLDISAPIPAYVSRSGKRLRTKRESKLRTIGMTPCAGSMRRGVTGGRRLIRAARHSGSAAFLCHLYSVICPHGLCRFFRQ